MADNIFRTTRRDPAANSASGSQQGDDPLAELARLIGRTAPQGRAARPHEAPFNAPEPAPAWPADARYAEPQQDASYAEPQPRYEDQPSDQYGAQGYSAQDPNAQDYSTQNYGTQDYAAQDYAAQDASQYDSQYDDRRQAQQPADNYPPYRAAPPSYNAEYEQPDHRYAAQPQRYDAEGQDAHGHDAHGHDDQRGYRGDQPAYQEDQPAYEDHPRYDDAHDPIQDLPAFLPRARDARRADRRDDGYEYAEEAQSEDDQAYDLEDYEDDEAPPPKRRGVAIFAALLGLMVLGTAGAFGYRAMFGGSMLPALPPIIKADGSPNKIVPAGNGANSSGQAAANNSGSPDKLVSREERPVDVPAPGNTPRVVSTIPVFPDPNAGLQASMTGQAQTGQSMPGAIAPGPGGNGAGVPMQIGSTAAAPAYGGPAAPPPMQAAPDQSGQAQVGAPVAGTSGSKKIRTVAIHAGQADSAADTAAPAARPAAPRGAAPQGGQGGAGPLSIVPSQGGQGSQASQAGADISRTRTALAHPAAPAAESAPAAAGGGYSVQVSSQRSEADAQSAYRGLQAKYPAQLGSRTASVRQVDLGGKGVYFRTLVGPYASAEEAAQMCSSLKAAGGSCLVQRN